MCPTWTEVGAAGQTLGVAVAAKADVTGGIVTPRMFQIPHCNPRPSADEARLRSGCRPAPEPRVWDRHADRAGRGRPSVNLAMEYCGGILRHPL